MDNVVNGILQLIDNSGLFGIFLGIFAESIFPPIPSEAILGYAGFLVGSGRETFILVLIVSVIGKLASSIPVWWLGKKYGKTFIKNYGRFIDYTMDDYRKAEKIFKRYGYFSVLVSQFIPLIRSLISIPAGSLGLRFVPFIVSTTIGAAIWNTFLIFIGIKLGENWLEIDSMLKPFLNPIKYLVIISIVAFLVFQTYKIYKVLKNKPTSN
jgi:membrane protein DedA with SNARE-associated domain